MKWRPFSLASGSDFMFFSATTRAQLHSPLTCLVIMYAFQLSFPFPGIAPAFLNIVQNRKILRNDLIIHCFWQQLQPAMFPSLLPQQFGGSLHWNRSVPQPSWKRKERQENLQKSSNRASVPQPSSHRFSQHDPKERLFYWGHTCALVLHTGYTH